MLRASIINSNTHLAGWPHTSGNSPKTEYLKIEPNAVCKRRKTAFSVYNSPDDDSPIASSGTARQAWAMALDKTTRAEQIKTISESTSGNELNQWNGV